MKICPKLAELAPDLRFSKFAQKQPLEKDDFFSCHKINPKMVSAKKYFYRVNLRYPKGPKKSVATRTAKTIQPTFATPTMQ